jgi:hypothetical protein
LEAADVGSDDPLDTEAEGWSVVLEAVVWTVLLDTEAEG